MKAHGIAVDRRDWAIVCQNVDEVKSMRSKKVLPLDRRLLRLFERYRRAADYCNSRFYGNYLAML